MPTAEMQIENRLAGALPHRPMTDDELDNNHEPKHRIPWGTVAAIAAIISTFGTALIALGRVMFASKDEYTELRVHVKENNQKVDHAIERLERSAEKLTNTIEVLDRNVTILNTKIGVDDMRRRSR